MKKWIFYTITTLLIALISIAMFNWFVDPMWTFNQSNFLNKYQNDFDERQQKSNLIYFKPFKYDAIMLGSSKVTYINQNHVSTFKTFNAAVNDMRPNEFIPMINIAKKANKADFKEIILGLDFERMMPNPKTTKMSDYEKNTISPLYRYKLLLSADTLRYSFQNINNIITSDYKRRAKVYNNNFVVFSYKKSKEHLESKIKQYNNPMDIQYNENLQLIFDELKKENPHTKFTIFITPLPSPLIKTIFSSEKNVLLYKKWIHQIINTFGSVHTFLYLNNINNDYLNTYTDAGHFYPFIGDILIKSLSRSDNNSSDLEHSYGIYIDHNNYEQIINTIPLKQGQN